MWAGPVSLEMINVAFSIKLIKVTIFTGLLSMSTILVFRVAASSISPGPGAVMIVNLFLIIL